MAHSFNGLAHLPGLVLTTLVVVLMGGCKARDTGSPPMTTTTRSTRYEDIFNTRTEGLATGWEEMMLQAGMFDARKETWCEASSTSICSSPTTARATSS